MGAPAATTGDAAAECLAVDEPLEAPVLELDDGLVGAVGGEADLDLAGVGGIGSYCQVGAQGDDAVGVEPVDAAGALGLADDQAAVLENTDTTNRVRAQALLALGWLDRRDSPAWRCGGILTLIK
jgi:hypothetical protein